MLKIIIAYLYIIMPCFLFSQVQKSNRSVTTLNFDCAPRIKIIDQEFDETNAVYFSSWEEILELDLSNPSGEVLVNFNEHFNMVADERFFVEARIPGVDDDEVLVDLISFNEEGEIIDQINNLALIKVPNENKKYRSEATLIVLENDEVDDNFDTQPSGTGIDPLWDNEDDVGRDPTIHAVIGGELVANYSNSSTDVSVCPDEAIKTVSINVYIMEDQDGEPFVDESVVEAQINMAKTLFQQPCLKLVINAPVILTPDSDFLENGLAWSDAGESQELIDLISQVKEVTNELKIDLIFVKQINFNSGGAAFGRALADFSMVEPAWIFNHRRTCIIANQSQAGSLLINRPFVTAHEIGHVLTNHDHYRTNYDTNATAGSENYNLMKSGTSHHNYSINTKRLKVYQANWTREETNIPQ